MVAVNSQEFFNSLERGRPLISVDYGAKKVGVAISDPSCNIAMPLMVIEELSDKIKVTKLLEIFNKHNIGGIVLGLPVNMDGSHSEQTKQTQEFVQRLEKRTKLPILLQDERLTSKAADSFLKQMGMSRKMRNKSDDSTAASLILETVLNSR
ncbi:MAG: hypothetical protein DGJ47_000245 [Rickettsiaceae bacterium]